MTVHKFHSVSGLLRCTKRAEYRSSYTRRTRLPSKILTRRNLMSIKHKQRSKTQQTRADQQSGVHFNEDRQKSAIETELKQPDLCLRVELRQTAGHVTYHARCSAFGERPGENGSNEHHAAKQVENQAGDLGSHEHRMLQAHRDRTRVTNTRLMTMLTRLLYSTNTKIHTATKITNAANAINTCLQRNTEMNEIPNIDAYFLSHSESRGRVHTFRPRRYGINDLYTHTIRTRRAFTENKQKNSEPLALRTSSGHTGRQIGGVLVVALGIS